MSQRPLLARIVILVGAILLVAGHGAFLYFMRAHMSLSIGAICSLLVVVLIKHLGLLGPLLGYFQRSRAKDKI